MYIGISPTKSIIKIKYIKNDKLLLRKYDNNLSQLNIELNITSFNSGEKLYFEMNFMWKMLHDVSIYNYCRKSSYVHRKGYKYKRKD